MSYTATVQKLSAPKLLKPRAALNELYFRLWGTVGRVLLVVVGALMLVCDIIAVLLSPFAYCLSANKVENPVVVVTGASSGMGAEFARQYAKNRQATLVITGRRENKLQAVADQCMKLGATKVVQVRSDVTEKDSGAQLRTAIEAEGISTVDVLFVNAGSSIAIHDFRRFSEEDMSTHEWEMDVNYMGKVRAFAALLPMLRKSTRPQVLVNGGLEGLTFDGGFIHKSTAKWTLRAFFHSVAQQVYKDGIQVSLAHVAHVESEAYFEKGKDGLSVIPVGDSKGEMDEATRKKLGTTATSDALERIIEKFDAGFEEIFVASETMIRAVKWLGDNGAITTKRWSGFLEPKWNMFKEMFGIVDEAGKGTEQV